jgi:glycosyl transferase, family 25
MKIDKIYIISLDHSSEYVKKATQYINQLNIDSNPTIDLGAFTGDKVLDVLTDLKRYEGWKLPNSTNGWWNREVTKGEIGGITSHINFWCAFYLSNADTALILEEDFIPEFESINWSAFKEIENYDWDLIYLGRHLQAGYEDVDLGFNYFVKPGYSYQSHAYLLSKSGVKKLIENYLPILKSNLIVSDEFLPATYTTHPRKDIEALYPDKLINALALNADMIAQTDFEGSGFSRTDPNFIT